jgi:hypothetical protein
MEWDQDMQIHEAINAPYPPPQIEETFSQVVIE